MPDPRTRCLLLQVNGGYAIVVGNMEPGTDRVLCRDGSLVDDVKHPKALHVDQKKARVANGVLKNRDLHEQYYVPVCFFMAKA